MNSQTVCKYLVTLGPIGYAPAPGTLATLVTIPLSVLLNNYSLSLLTWILISSLITTGTFAIINYALPLFHHKNDPSEIVLDEVLGCLIAFFNLPQTLPWLALNFVLFRFFDITKPLFIKKCEKLPGAVGIIADDIAAAIATQCVMRFIILFVS